MTAVTRQRRDHGVLWVLWRLMVHRPGLFGGHLVYITLAAYALPLAPGLIVRALLDRLGGATSGPTPTLLLGALTGVVLTDLAMRVSGSVLVMTLRQHAEVLQRRNLLARVLERPGARALPGSAGDSLIRFTRDPSEVSHALDFLGDPLGQLVGFTFVFAVLAGVDAFLTFAVVVPATAVMLVARLFGPRVSEARRRRQESLGGVTGLLGDAFAAVATVQAAGAEELVTRRLVDLGETRRRAVLRDVAAEQIVTSFSTNTATIATGALLLLAASGTRGGDLSPGDFAIFTSYLRWLAMAIAFVGHVMTTLRQASVSVERMGEVLQAPASEVVAARPVHLRGPLPPSTPATPTPDLGRLQRLEVDAITFVHPSSERGVRDVSLSVEAGEIVVVTGRIGSGKTTLLRSVLGLLPPDRGVVRWNGTVIADAGRFFVPPRAAYTAQVPRLFSATVADNVRLGLDLDDDRLRAAARMAVLDRDISEFGSGWNTPVGSRGVMLSGGQLQRTAAARMFVRHADLLVLDDLSSALDVDTEEELWSRLLDERIDSAFLVVTHRRAVLERADRILVLRDGELDACGPLGEVLRSSAEMRSLWSAEP